MRVKFSRCNSADLATIPISDGQLIYVKDNGNGYMDVGNTRIQLTNTVVKALVDTNTQGLIDTNIRIDNIRAMKSFTDYPSIITNGTTAQLFSSIDELNLGAGTILLGGCSLTDGPFIGNEEVKVEVYPNHVFHGVLTSTNVAPYEWTIQYWHGGTWTPRSQSSWGSISGDITRQEDLQTALSGKASKVNGHQVVNGEVTIPANASFPEDMFTQTFNNIEDFCNYFHTHHEDLCVQGACFQGTFRNILDMPSSDNGGELILKVFEYNNLYQIDFYSTNTNPHHWYTMYMGTQQFPWIGMVQNASELAYDNTSSGLTATTVQGAIDEIATMFTNISNRLDSINGEVI